MFLLLLLLQHMTATFAGFNWGAGCGGGNGTFSVNLTTSGQLVDVGTIPAGKWNVRVYLSATSDVDVQIFDTDDTSTFPEGKALVAWCANAKTCNIGELGSDEGSGTTLYKNMNVKYSGYGGTNNQPGKEYVLIDGKTAATLSMKAFAFEAGVAKVDYSWDRVQTKCCLGIAPCTGHFSMAVPKDATVNIGDIPKGKKDLRVQLYSEKDVDIQLYDLEDTSNFAEGKAIIGYCDTTGCNQGLLGNNDGTTESATYKALSYEYSGYEGIKGQQGNEHLVVHGISNTKLSMRAFGYAAGQALVSYSYYEDFTQTGPIQPSIDWMIPVNRRDAKTELFRQVPPSTLLVRRDNSFQFLVSSPSNGVAAANVSVRIESWVGPDFRYGTAATTSPPSITTTTKTNAIYPDNVWRLTAVNDGATRVSVTIALTETAPVGVHRLTTAIQVKENGYLVTYERSIMLIVLFNPYGKRDAVRQSASNVAEYVVNENGLIWQGLSDANTAHSWHFDQFSFPNLAISLDTIRRMNVTERSDAVLVSRHITYAVGQDICYGKWGGGSYTTGKPSDGYRCSNTKTTATNNRCYEPGHWTGTTELFELHSSLGGQRVQYCQCFVYAGVMTTIGRSLGIPSRPVTTFQSAHDTNRDRSISKYYTIDAVTGVFLPTEAPAEAGHDSIWSFHVWNEFFMRRPLLNNALQCKTCSDGWQAVDATPQEISSGGDTSLPLTGYYMGPASLKLLRLNSDPICRKQTSTYGCYDSQFVISEVNANILMYTKPAGGDGTASFSLYPENCGTTTEECGFPTDPFGDEFGSIGLQISTKKKGPVSASCLLTADSDAPKDCSADLDDVTNKYKQSEPSGPGAPTTGGNRRRLASSFFVANASLGMAPSSSGPVVNEPGHPGSSVRIGVVPVTTHNTVPSNLTCSLHVTAQDYTGNVLGPVFNATIVNSKECLFPTITRAQWRQYASTYMDVQDGYGEMAPGERAYALHFVVTAINAVDGALVLVDERNKIICTPIIGAGSLRTKLICDDHRGIWLRPSDSAAENNALQHLNKNVATQNCRDAGVTKGWASRGGPNDGVCQASNNVNGCWDGGDCCSFSCWEKNGEFKELASDGKAWQFAHTCYDIDEATQCLDPTFANNVFAGRPLDFTQPAPADSFGATTIANSLDDEDLCQLSAANMTSIVSDFGCSSVVQELICGDALMYANDECRSSVADILFSAQCEKPRCAPRTVHGCRCQNTWSFRNSDGSMFEYTKHACGNPYLGDSDGGYHYNNWCEIVPGSCTAGESGSESGSGSADGNPGSRSAYFDSTENSWWDDCSSGAVDHLTGKLLVPVSWTASEVALVDVVGSAAAGGGGENVEVLVEVSRKKDNSSPSPSSNSKGGGVLPSVPAGGGAPSPSPSPSPSKEERKENSGGESPSSWNEEAHGVTTDGAGVTSDGGCRGQWSVVVVVGLAWWCLAMVYI